MNELIKVDFSGERPAVSARELHEFLGVETRFNDWFSRMCEYGFLEGEDFYSFLSRTGSRSRKSIILTFQPEVHTTHFPASKVGIPDLKHSGVISVDN